MISEKRFKRFLLTAGSSTSFVAKTPHRLADLSLFSRMYGCKVTSSIGVDYGRAEEQRTKVTSRPT
jgi:hypothetical protein